ncbi:MAG: HD domain-containing protein [Phycisphaerae bacterium]|nr:HD domain-containing protein [Phycisphaerae bacterium]
MGKGFRVRDPVHDFVCLREEEVKLIGTSVFQRLRGIRQLAMANLVYPGALHTRFDHSLGVCHVAGLLAEQLGLAEHDARLVRLAGLLHDLGHGPFSHVSEHVLERYGNRSTLASGQKKEKIHELMTAWMIRHDPEIIRIIGQDTCDEIAKLLGEGHGQPANRAIVSGPLDADKQDYLLRDSRFCGVTYGVFDIHQLHRSLVLEGPEHDKELMIAPDGVHAVEQYVLAKYYLTTNVYRHRVRLITDQMIVRAIRLGIERDDLEELRRLYAFDNSDDFFENYRGWDDARFLLTFSGADSKQGLCNDVLGRLRSRNLLKRVFACRIRDFSPPALQELLMNLDKRENDTIRAKLERSIAGILPKEGNAAISPSFVIVHTFTIRSVRVTSRNDEGSIMVACRPEPRPFEQESALFESIDESYTEGYVEVYAPVTWANSTERKRVKSKLEQEIRKLIESMSPRDG